MDEFRGKQEDDKNEILEFLGSVDKDLPDCLFGENADDLDVIGLISDKNDEESDRLAKAVF